MYAYLYDQHSESGRALVQEIRKAIPVLVIRHKGSTYRGDEDKIVLNWGCSDLPRKVRNSFVINNEKAVYLAVDKRRCLNRMVGLGVPYIPFTTERHTALEWQATGSPVYARRRVQGHDGDGLVLVHPGDEMPDARLYTRGVGIREEYRVTVVCETYHCDDRSTFKVLAAQRKVKADDAPRTTNDLVRTSANGWGFKLIDHTRYLPESVRDAALASCRALGLHFGGVDVILCHDGSAAVLEVNTAPQLTPTVCRRLARHLVETYTES